MTTQDSITLACTLWHGSFHGTLSTHSQQHPGYPFGSVVPFCLDHSGCPLMLLSHVAQHSKNLAADGRCGLLIGEHGAEDPQRQARLSAVGQATLAADAKAPAIERYFRHFPHTRPYFEELNFRFYRFEPAAFHLNAGFAAARWIGRDRMALDARLAADRESEWIAQAPGYRDLIDSAWRRLTGNDSATESTPVEIAGIDPWGANLRRGERLERLGFRAPLTVEISLEDALSECSFPGKPL